MRRTADYCHCQPSPAGEMSGQEDRGGGQGQGRRSQRQLHLALVITVKIVVRSGRTSQHQLFCVFLFFILYCGTLGGSFMLALSS